MNIEQLKQVNRDYRKRLKYFAFKLVEDDFWAESFADGAIMKIFKKDFSEDREIMNFLYNKVLEECLQYLKAYGKTLSMEQVKFLFFDCEILNELCKNKLHERTES